MIKFLRWHLGFGKRCLAEAKTTLEVIWTVRRFFPWTASWDFAEKCEKELKARGFACYRQDFDFYSQDHKDMSGMIHKICHTMIVTGMLFADHEREWTGKTANFVAEEMQRHGYPCAKPGKVWA